LKEEALLQKLNKKSKEKLELEELIIKQDEKMNDLGNKIAQIELLLKRKNEELKNNETQANSLIKIIEEQKKQILVFKEEKRNITNLENEIIYLRNYNESLKDDALAKDEIIRELKHKLTKKNKHQTHHPHVNSNSNENYYTNSNNNNKYLLNQAHTNYKSLLGQAIKNEITTDYDKDKMTVLPNINSHHNQIQENNNSNNSNNQLLKNENNTENNDEFKSNAYEQYLKLQEEENQKHKENYSKLNDKMKMIFEV